MKYKYNATHTDAVQVYAGVSYVLNKFDYYLLFLESWINYYERNAELKLTMENLRNGLAN